MSPSPTDTAPPPSYQLSMEEFDQKTSQVIRNSPEVGEDGWEVYDEAAFAGNHEPSSSSARILGSDTNRHERRRRSSAKVSRRLTTLKVRNAEQNSQPEDEHRVASPPPPFTPTGPPLDGPPFDEVVGSSYYEYGPDSTATPVLEPYPPSPRSPSPQRRALPPVPPLRSPLRPRANRLPNSQLQTSSNPYSSHRAISPIPNRTSTIARVEFDPQMAYSPYGGSGGNIRADASAFYNHAVASHLTTSSAITAQTRPGYTERVSPPYSGGYTPTTWAQQATSVSFHEQRAPHMHNLHFGGPATHVGDTRSPPPGTIRAPLPPVPNSVSQLRWAGTEQQIMQDVYGGRYGGHG